MIRDLRQKIYAGAFAPAHAFGAAGARSIDIVYISFILLYTARSLNPVSMRRLQSIQTVVIG